MNENTLAKALHPAIIFRLRRKSIIVRQYIFQLPQSTDPLNVYREVRPNFYIGEINLSQRRKHASPRKMPQIWLHNPTGKKEGPKSTSQHVKLSTKRLSKRRVPKFEANNYINVYQFSINFVFGFSSEQSLRRFL